MSQWQFPRARILVFARAPRAGQVKTRLQPVLGDAGCYRLYRQLLESTLSRVQSSGLAPVQLWVDQDPHHEDFLRYCNTEDIFLQEGADLGCRMAHAADLALCCQTVDSVLLIGSDCPALDTTHLHTALHALHEGAPASIAAAEDGGYVLLGLRKAEPHLFTGIEWGKERVFEDTMRRFAELGLTPEQLPVLWDVDRPEDLPRLLALDAERFGFLAES